MTGLAAGFGCLPRGWAIVLRSRRAFVLGLVPPVLVAVLLLAALVALLTLGPDALGALDGDVPGWARVVLVVAAAGAVAVVGVVAFTTLTLALGSPVYEAISGLVDRRLAPADPSGAVADRPAEPWWRGARRAVGQTLALVSLSAVTAVACLLLGLVPVAGTAIAAVVAAVVGGWLVTLELTGAPGERRGLRRLRERHRLLRGQWWRVLGFAVPTYLLLNVPFVAVVVFPAAVAGATLLVRQLTGEPTTRVSSRPSP